MFLCTFVCGPRSFIFQPASMPYSANDGKTVRKSLPFSLLFIAICGLECLPESVYKRYRNQIHNFVYEMQILFLLKFRRWESYVNFYVSAHWRNLCYHILLQAYTKRAAKTGKTGYRNLYISLQRLTHLPRHACSQLGS